MCDLMEKLDNRFFTRVLVDKYATLVIIDDFSCNLISTYAVEKLGLSIIDHPCPYEIMRYDQLISVTKQVWVSFSLGKYKDSILCDVTHMEDCHLHFGNPWKKYRSVTHNPVNNYYCVVMERNYTLIPMSKEEAQRDVDRLKERVQTWLDEKNGVCEEDEVDVDDSQIPIMEDSIDNVGNSGVMELQEVENPKTVVIHFDLKEVQVVDELNPIVGQIEIQESFNHLWLWDNIIDRSHDEWFEPSRGYAIDGVNCRVDAKKLWELLFQRGFVELEESLKPSVAGHIYLTFFQFCRIVFDPGGNLFRFEDESSQEGGNDMIWGTQSRQRRPLNDQATRGKSKERSGASKHVKAGWNGLKAAGLEAGVEDTPPALN